MNKSLLIIICDFLLISVLALVEFKPEVDIEGVNQEVLQQQAAEEMLELLQLSLENENAQRREIEETLGDTREELDQTKSQLEDTSTTLDQVNQDLSATEAERSALADSLQDTRSTLQLTLEEKQNLETSLLQNREQAQRLQEELRSQQELASQRNRELEAARENLQQLESQQQRMSTEMQILDTEKKMLQENLVAARAEVERARIEAERAETRSESLAAGVSELAASSTALKEEIRQAKVLSQNAIFKQFEDNRVFVLFQWEERNLFTTVKRQAALQSLMLDTGNGVFAVFATANTPLNDDKARALSATLKIGERSFVISEVGFLLGEPGIVAVQVPAETARESGLKTFAVATEPLRFSNAVLVSDDQALYGETPIRVPPGEDGYLEIQTRLFNRLFGEFSPSSGDYVFSMTGELTGIMVRQNRARILENPRFGNYRQLRAGN